jgi:hypothetical protein
VRLPEFSMNDQFDPTNDPAFIETVRLTAYFLWEQDGRPEGRAEEYWRRAWEKHRAERQYDRWLGEEIRKD